MSADVRRDVLIDCMTSCGIGGLEAEEAADLILSDASGLIVVDPLRAPVVPPTDDTTCPNCGLKFPASKGYCDWCGHRPVPPTMTPDQVTEACDWVSGIYTGPEDHTAYHFGNVCPYSVVAALLLGLPDPRRSVSAPIEPDEPTKEAGK